MVAEWCVWMVMVTMMMMIVVVVANEMMMGMSLTQSYQSLEDRQVAAVTPRAREGRIEQVHNQADQQHEGNTSSSNDRDQEGHPPTSRQQSSRVAERLLNN